MKKLNLQTIIKTKPTNYHTIEFLFLRNDDLLWKHFPHRVSIKYINKKWYLDSIIHPLFRKTILKVVKKYLNNKFYHLLEIKYINDKNYLLYKVIDRQVLSLIGERPLIRSGCK